MLQILLHTADISGCYDSIHLETLIWKLYHNFNLRGRILLWLYSYLKKRYTKAIIGQWILKLNGLGQGDTLSPILNVMFTDQNILHILTLPVLLMTLHSGKAHSNITNNFSNNLTYPMFTTT